MGTRGIIARPDGRDWKGRYHHWDSHPESLGRTLWRIYREDFKRDIGRMLRVLIDEHFSWSTINGTNFDLEPRHLTARQEQLVWEMQEATGDRLFPPKCHCHGPGREPDEKDTYLTKRANVPFAYVLDEKKLTMKVYECKYDDGWQLLASLYLEGEEPKDWAALKGKSTTFRNRKPAGVA